MNKIEQMHLDVMKEVDSNFTNSLGFFITRTASKSAEITEQIAIEFAEWCESNAVREKSGMWMMYSNPTTLITKEQLFQEFLKTKQ